MLARGGEEETGWGFFFSTGAEVQTDSTIEKKEELVRLQQCLESQQRELFDREEEHSRMTRDFERMQIEVEQLLSSQATMVGQADPG